MEIEDIVSSIAPTLDLADGLTISGGEPFDQAEALVAFLERIRPRVSGDILLFSGYDLANIPPTGQSALKFLDAVVCGPFVVERGSDQPLLGSDNQRIHVLSTLGDERYSKLETSGSPAIDLVVSKADGIWFAGIPRPGDLHRLDAILRDRGIGVTTSAGRLRARDA